MIIWILNLHNIMCQNQEKSTVIHFLSHSMFLILVLRNFQFCRLCLCIIIFSLGNGLQHQEFGTFHFLKNCFLLLDAYSSGQSVKVTPGVIDGILHQFFHLKGIKSHKDCTSFCNVEPGPIGQPSVVSTLLSMRLCPILFCAW